MGERRQILVADDSPLFCELEALFLARAGEVVTASDGEAALAAMRREPPAVAVLDLHMPGLSGDDLCRAVKGDPALRETPVVIVVGDAAEDHERAVRAGADDVVTKPVSRVALIEAVNRLMRESPPALARVPFETEVRMSFGRGRRFGTARNLSRGGMFVQAANTLPADAEVGLCFSLPDSDRTIESTARVVWSRDRGSNLLPGMGLRFLRLDRYGASRIEDFVHQHARETRRGSGAKS